MQVLTVFLRDNNLNWKDESSNEKSKSTQGSRTSSLPHLSSASCEWPWPLTSCDLDLWPPVTLTFDLLWSWPLTSCGLDLWPPVTLTFDLLTTSLFHALAPCIKTGWFVFKTVFTSLVTDEWMDTVTDGRTDGHAENIKPRRGETGINL